MDIDTNSPSGPDPVARTLDALDRIAPTKRDGQRIGASLIAEHLAVNPGGTPPPPLVIEAPTGSGKSFMYLAGAVASEAERIVVVASTKGLQDQLGDKDLPHLARSIPGGVDYAVLKGRSNYLCDSKLAELTGDGRDGTMSLEGTVPTDIAGVDPDDLAAVIEWARTTTDGDLSRIAVPHVLRGKVTIDADSCPGRKKCPYGDVCWAERAKDRARGARVVVVNMALYGLDVALDGQVLPEHDVVIIDEAQKALDAFASALGNEVTGGAISRFGAEFGRLAGPEHRPVTEKLNQAGRAFLAAMGDLKDSGGSGRLSYPLPIGLTVALDDTATGLAVAEKIVRTYGSVDLDGVWSSEDPRAERVMVQLIRLAERVRSARCELDDVVVFTDGDALRIIPLDISEVMADRVWEARHAVLTSATIPMNIAATLGLGDVDIVRVESPFDFARNGLMYVGEHLPPVNSPEWAAEAYPEMARLIRAAGGRTLGLFTSYANMDAAAEAIRPMVPYRILTQRDLGNSKAALLEEFTADEATCLFATQGFYEGVDVQGSTLSLVIIDRIPFPHRFDPVMTARSEAAGQGGWFRVDMPHAATLLTQAVGRLIRTSTDRGAVALFDNRLLTKWQAYGSKMSRSLPPFRKTKVLSDVEAFLRSCVPPPEVGDLDLSTMSAADVAALVPGW